MEKITKSVIFVCIGFLLTDPCSGEVKSLLLSTWDNPDRLYSIVNFTGPKSTTTQISFNTNSPRISSIACNAKRQELYLYAAKNMKMYKMSPFDGAFTGSYNITVVRDGVSDVFGSLAFDSITENLYWTDRSYNWIAMMPVDSSDITMYTVIIEKDIEDPEALTLDPAAGYMFWSDTSLRYRIERANLAGGDRKVLIHKSLSRILGLTTDSSARSLYWVDVGRQTIEMCDYDGNNRRVLTRRNGVTMKSIDIEGNYLYITTDKMVLKTDKVSGRSQRLHDTSTGYFALHIFRSSQNNLPNPCSSKACSQMCANTPTGPVCLCKEGFQLSSDGRTCSDKTSFYERGIVFADGQEICMLHIESISGFLKKFLCKNVTSSSIGAITADRSRAIFYDLSEDSIKSLPFYGNSIPRTIISAVGRVKRMVYNWKDDVLFWIDEHLSSIKANDFGTSSSILQIYKNLVQPDFITIDPHKELIFWIDGTMGQRKITKGYMGGTIVGPSVVFVEKASLSSPTGLTYDVMKNRLFFIDGGILKSVSDTAVDLQTYGSVGSGTELVIYKDYGVWSGSIPTVYSRRLKNVNFTYSLRMSNANKFSQMTLYDIELMKDESGSCSLMNGGCEHVCLPALLGRVCACEHGYTLRSDQTSCSSSILQQDFVLVSDYTHNKLYQISLDGQQIEALNLPDLKGVNSAIFNAMNKMIYYVETSSKQIRSSSLDGTNISTIFTQALARPERLALDYSTGYLYYTAESSSPGILLSYIGVIRLDYMVYRTVVTGLDRPRAITLFPSRGYIFWTDFGNSSSICRSHMDGSSKLVVVSRDIRWPNGLAIDYLAERLYWTDGFYNVIESCDLSGGNRQRLLKDDDAHLVDIILRGAYIYYTAWKRQKVIKALKSTGTYIDWMKEAPEFGRLDTVDIYPGDVQPVSNICKDRNGECSTFCFPKPNGRVCGCQNGVQLGTDGRTCSDMTLCPPTIRNGLLSSSCLKYANERCNFTCNKGYRPRQGISDIQCGRLGRWNEDADFVCQAITCPSVSTSAGMIEKSDSCDSLVGSRCKRIQCNVGFTKRDDVTFLTCLSQGNWDLDINDVCITSGEASNLTEEKSNTFTIAGGVGGVVVLIIIICLIIVFVRRRCRSSRSSYNRAVRFDSGLYAQDEHLYDDLVQEGNKYDSLRYFRPSQGPTCSMAQP